MGLVDRSVGSGVLHSDWLQGLVVLSSFSLKNLFQLINHKNKIDLKIFTTRPGKN
jgi:hypothetical protein